MNLVRQHTDYAFRLLVALAQAPGKPISTRTLASAADVPYQFASKIMQKLHEEGLVESVMGPFGGFHLVEPDEKVNLLKIIEAVQGPVVINTCLLGQEACPRSAICPIRTRLEALQTMMIDYLQSVTLADLTAGRLKPSKKAKEKEGNKNEHQKFSQSRNSGKSS
ncbi:MAG TPA: Rrf2 family transcriptional regulator [Candidatus Saccharicenans sp.]|jgi:Rrf2 family protein|nr:Rrf2 family transcriptional regulator [Candidatus Saccharicenans sp.]